MMDNLDQLGKLLKDLRLQRGWELEDLEARCGIHTKSLRHYEQGKAVPKIRSLAQVADAFGFRASDLLDDINL